MKASPTYPFEGGIDRRDTYAKLWLKQVGTNWHPNTLPPRAMKGKMEFKLNSGEMTPKLRYELFSPGQRGLPRLFIFCTCGKKMGTKAAIKHQH